MVPVSGPYHWTIVATVAIACGGVAVSDDARIEVSYTGAPTHPLAPDISIISVQKPEYSHRAHDDGIMRDRQGRWYDLLIRLLESKFRAAAPHVTVVNWEDRANTGAIERARLIDGGDPDAPAAAPSRSPDALIVARFVFSTPRLEHLRVRTKLHDRVLKGAARRIPIFGGAIDNPRYESRYRVRVNVSCNLHMTRVGSHETLLSYGRDLEAAQVTDAGVFGYGAQQLFELDTVETLIASLIEEHVDNFLAEMVPVQRRVTKTLSRVPRRVAEAVEKLNAGDLDASIDRAFRAWGRDKDCHEACFVIGLAWELRARRGEAVWSQAVAWYSRALERRKDDADYSTALTRAQAGAKSGAQLAGR